MKSFSESQYSKENSQIKANNTDPKFWRDKQDFDEEEETERMVRLSKKTIIMDPALKSKMERCIQDGSIKEKIDAQLSKMNLIRKKTMRTQEECDEDKRNPTPSESSDSLEDTNKAGGEANKHSKPLPRKTANAANLKLD